MKMIKAYVTNGAITGGGGKLKAKGGGTLPDELMTHVDYVHLAQKHVASAAQRYDRLGERLARLNDFVCVPRIACRCAIDDGTSRVCPRR